MSSLNFSQYCVLSDVQFKLDINTPGKNKLHIDLYKNLNSFVRRNELKTLNFNVKIVKKTFVYEKGRFVFGFLCSNDEVPHLSALNLPLAFWVVQFKFGKNDCFHSKYYSSILQGVFIF